MTDKQIVINIEEVKRPDLSAQLVAENVAGQLLRRIGFRRAMKKTVQGCMKAGALGVKIMCAGRLGGAEMSRTEWYREGRVPAAHAARRHRLRPRRGQDQVRPSSASSVWVFRGEIFNKKRQEVDALRAARFAPFKTDADTEGSKGHATPENDQDTARCRRAAAAARPTAAARSPSAPSASRPMECGWITNRQIEAARIAISRTVKRGGKLWIRIFPDKPLTVKPAETRMGKRQGQPGALGRRRQARPHPLRDSRVSPSRPPAKPWTRHLQAPPQVQVRRP
jgi:hypothetical protein